MRPLKHFELLEDGSGIMALDENGDLWVGTFDLDDQWAFNWMPLNGPPDGDHLQAAYKDKFDQLEQQGRKNIEQWEKDNEKFETASE